MYVCCMQGDGQCTQTWWMSGVKRGCLRLSILLCQTPAPPPPHQSGAATIDWPVYRHGHIALFRKSVSISRHLSAQPQVSDQYKQPPLLKGAFAFCVRGALPLRDARVCMRSGPAASVHPRDAEVLNGPRKARLG